MIEDQSTAEFDNHGEGLSSHPFCLENIVNMHIGRSTGAVPEPAPVFRYEKHDFAEEKNSAVRKAADKIKADNFLHERQSVEKQKERHAFY